MSDGIKVAAVIACLIAWSNAGHAQQAAPAPHGAGGVSPAQVLLMDAANERQLLYGSMPLLYKVLGLTAEQEKEIEGLCSRAKEENNALYKTLKPPPDRRPKTLKAYRPFHENLQAKQKEMLEKYRPLIEEILTGPQRDALKRIRAVADMKVEEDRKLNEEWKRRRNECAQLHEKKLDEILTPEQKEMLEQLATRKKDVR